MKLIDKILKEGLDNNKIWYHTSNVKFDKFSDEFVGRGNDEAGPGVYLSNKDPNDDLAYKSDKSGYFYTVEWRPKKLISTKRRTITAEKVKQFILTASDWEDTAQNWDESPQRGVAEFIRAVFQYSNSDNEIMQAVWYDWFKNEPVKWIRNMVKLGWDGFIRDFKDEWGIKHAIVFNPETIIIKDIQQA